MDSSVLFHLLLKAGIPFSVAHVDHMTREGDSTQDAEFVEKICDDYKIEFHLCQLEYQTEDIGNFQAFAHEQRYAFFNSLEFDLILTAHHQDDIVESIILNFIQGRSLGGIYEQLGNVIRPLLPFSRKEISEYAFENDIPYIEDYTNLDTSYDRNFIRNELLPLIRPRIQNLNKRIINLGDKYASHQKLIKELLSKYVIKDQDRFHINKSVLMQSEVPSTLLFEVINRYDFTNKQCEEILKSINSTGAQVSSVSHILTIDRDVIFIDPIIKRTPTIAFDYKEQNEIEFNKHRFHLRIVDTPEFLKKKSFAYFPVKLLNPSLNLRQWKAGDSFKPFGMKGHSQSLKKFFTEQKVDIYAKKEIPLLLNGRDIIWVVPFRTHNDYAVKEDNGPYLEIRYEVIPD